MAAHPHDHERDDPDRGDADDGLEPFLLALRQLLVEQLEGDADGDADRDGRADADPHRAQRVAPALLAQEPAMMPTMSAASTPSRRPITKLGSMS